MNQLKIVVSSTRPGRIGPKVAEWVATQADSTWECELVDLSSLPFFDEQDMPKNGNYANDHTNAWASTVFESDAVIVVTPQYNRSFPAPIKNAIDYLYAEWGAKPIGLVGYSWNGAIVAVADLAKVLTHVKADVVGQVGLVFAQDLSPQGELIMSDAKEAELGALLDVLSATVGERMTAGAI